MTSNCFKVPVPTHVSGHTVITYAINCCMEFVTLQALNQMFVSEKQSDAK